MSNAEKTLDGLHSNSAFELVIPGLKFAHIMRRYENVARRNELVDLRTIVVEGTCNVLGCFDV